MKLLKLKTSILIASIYAAVFFGVMYFINKTYPSIHKTMRIDDYQVLKSWQGWTPLVLGVIAIILFGVLVYITDWKKKR